MGVSRQHYYDIKKTIDEEGLDGLLEQSRRTPRIGNRVFLEIEQKVLDYSLQYPTHGQTRTANELKLQGVMISAGGVRNLWLRHNLQIKSLRLKRLEAWAAENTNILIESQVKALEEAKESFITSISGSNSGICERIFPTYSRLFSYISVSRQGHSQFYRWHGYSCYISCHHHIKYYLVWIATASPDRRLVFYVAQ